ncbi:PadR family transcriptional regulator [Ekhidna sp.]|uniref:PadR family transcriptional regulator n=2 Tax=Ekhidna sp. TaxID=2608089 RepID=UPI003299D680
MKKYQLGEFEEIVLLTVGVLFNEAYGVAIKEEIEKRLKRKVSVGALQSALRRMEKKGYLDSRQGEANQKRGGKPKRFFTITAYGKEALKYSQDVRIQLWNAIPEVALDLKISL